MVQELPGENELVVVEGVDHFFTGKVAELGAAITQWSEGALRRAH